MAVKAGSNQMRRRLIIGSNVFLAVIIVWVIIVMVNFIAAKVAPMPADLTRTGQFSVSPRTIKLLENLKDNITLVALYRVNEGAEEKQQEQERQQRRPVEDLLRRYQDISSKIHYQMLDPLKDTAAKTTLIKELIKQYSGETAKHKNVVESFKTLAPKMIKLLESERNDIKKLAQSDAKFSSDKNIVAIYYRMNVDFNNVKSVSQDALDLVAGGEDIPRYSEAVDMITKVYQSVKDDLQAVSDYLSKDGQKIEGLPADVKQSFADSPKRYKEVSEAIVKQLAEATNLPKLELEQIYDQVKQKNAKTIIVRAEGSSKVKVLTFQDVWAMAQPRPGADQNTVQYEFKGEAAVSSAIMALTVKEKSAVIFVHAGQPSPIKPGFNMMRMSQPPYSAVKEKLEQANFIVEAWDMQTSPQPPEVAQAKRKIYVITPSMPQRPEQPGMPPMGGYKPQHVEAIGKLIDQGERMMFLVNFSPAIMAQPYPFGEMLEKKLGVKADAGKLVLRGMKYRDKIFPASRIEIIRYDDFDITKPIQSLNTSFEMAVPLKVADKLPDNIKVTPLISITTNMENYWAESNLMMLMQNRWAEMDDNDTKPPFCLALAVENSKNKGKEIVFGNDIFATDAMVNDAQPVLTAQGFGQVYMNPGNIELFTNSVFWLNDNENMIAVGPRGTDVARIADISDAGQNAWKAFLWVIWPMGALVSGGIVYLFRRK